MKEEELLGSVGERIRLINEDSVRLLSSNEFVGQEKSKYDLIITDPPYVISRKTGMDSQASTNGIERFRRSFEFGDWDTKDSFTLDSLTKAIEGCYAILKNGGTLIMFYDLWKIQELAEAMTRAGFKQLRFIEWIKTNPVPINSKTNYLTNAREVAITAVKKAKPFFKSEYDNGIYRDPIYHGKDRFHPTQKPIRLFQNLIAQHCPPNGQIFDPFHGSGTTTVAAVNLNKGLLNASSQELNGYKIDPSIKYNLSCTSIEKHCQYYNMTIDRLRALGCKEINLNVPA